MTCAQARKLFGAYWDDDTTQAEREWLDAHLTGCGSCRREYDELTRVLEWTASLPRVEPAPDLVERTLARARRAVPAPDRVPTTAVPWVPVTAAAALLLVAGTLISSWIGLGPRRVAEPVAELPAVVEPVADVESASPAAPAPAQPVAEPGAVAAIPDSIFDPSADVEFILDPVTMRRGRASVTRASTTPLTDQAIITF